MTENTIPAETPERLLRIWQQNVNRSQTGQLSLLNTTSPTHIDIFTIQEPWLSPVNLTAATSAWRTVYPSTHLLDNAPRSRTVTLISTRIATNSWSQIAVQSPDVVAIEIQTEDGPIRLINIYVDGSHDEALDALETAICGWNQDDQTHLETRMIWMGDFNRHHPRWDSVDNHHLFTRANLRAADRLIARLEVHDMTMTLPPDIPTLEALRSRNLTRVDNVFASSNMVQSIILCDTKPDERPPLTDHFPIWTHIRCKTDTYTSPPKRNFQQVDWEEFCKTLSAHLQREPFPQHIRTRRELRSAYNHLTTSIITAINANVPVLRPSPYWKRWWTKELKQMAKTRKSMARRASKFMKKGMEWHPCIEEYRAFRREYGKRIAALKAEHWATFLSDLDAQNVFKASRLVLGPPMDGGRARIPALVNPNDPQGPTITENQAKSRIFYDTFFVPPADETDLEIPDGYEPPPPAFPFKPITDHQIARAITRLAPYKAPGPNGIPNVVFVKCKDIVTPYLGKIFRACTRLRYYFDEWKLTHTVVIRKPGKPNYGLAKAYRPIALKDTMAKLMAKCIAEDIMFYTEQLSLLPANHFGSRRGRTSTDAIHYTISWVRHQLRQGKVVTLSIIDIKSAFPSTDPRRLIYELQRRGIPTQYVEWIETMLGTRTTRLCFDDYQSETFRVRSGLDQGCPLSPILYLFYTAPLLETTKGDTEMETSGYVDDLNILAAGYSFAETHRKTEDLMDRPGGFQEWNRTHNSSMECDKVAVIDFSFSKNKDWNLPLRMGGYSVKPAKSHKYLGVHIDSKLTFKEHAAYALRKGASRATQIQRLGRTTGGIQAQYARLLYFSVVVPSMLYATDVFCKPFRGRYNSGREKGSIGVARSLQRVQRQMALLITGAMRTTANDVLYAHAGLLPVRALLNKLCMQAASRLATLPKTHPLHPWVQRATRYVQRHRAPLHELIHAFNLEPQTFEDIGSYWPTHKRPPILPATIHSNREQAVAFDRNLDRQVRLYSDGSAHSGGVGAAAALFRGKRRPRTIQVHLGPSTQHTVYEAELVGMTLAVHLLNKEKGRLRTASIGVDNQAALKSMENPRPRSGHYIVKMLEAQCTRLQNSRPTMTITGHWAPGHSKVEGNELVDGLAKQAAAGTTSTPQELPKPLRKTLPISLAAFRQEQTTEITTQANTKWQQSTRHTRTVRTDPRMRTPRTHFIKLISPLSKCSASLLMQLRTGHAPLNLHLQRIGRADRADCPNCPGTPETVKHFLIDCPTYEQQRRTLTQKDRRRSRAVRHLLSDKDLIPLTIQYIHQTEYNMTQNV